ncbi:macrolide 2'-phosphotransferase [Paenibacillus sp. UNC499MF]|uniref:macrolide 2'-phosphotransferase n=1 Tax=Paenibacillus sp. UNC499MF TaxID=1502751 RepID=UPI000CDEAB80|nr:macrolide 2'-phosphotransferase [Paenibacillus sp. UNC499MF]
MNDSTKKSTQLTEQEQLNQFRVLAVKYNLKLDLSQSMELNDSGLDFLAASARTTDGAAWMLRIPRRPDVIQSAVYEAKVLELVSRKLPVAVPGWQINRPDFIAYRKLPGTPAATIDTTAMAYKWHIDPEALSSEFVQSLAAAIAALHRINGRTAEQAGLLAVEAGDLRAGASARMEVVRQAYGVSEELWERWQAWLADASYWPQHTSLIHGDLHPGHILVDENERVCGLLDWTEAECGDPAADFSAFYTVFGEEALSRLLEEYEKAGGRVWPRMKEHIVQFQVAYPVSIALFALKSGLEQYADMAREALGVPVIKREE